MKPHITEFSISSDGLTLTHNIHLDCRVADYNCEFNFPKALAEVLESFFRGDFQVCSHITFAEAGERLDHLHLDEAAPNRYVDHCEVEGCKTSFGGFEYEAPKWRELSFRIERKFGWLEWFQDEDPYGML